MKKIITMCLSALLILTLAACAGNQAPHGNSSSEPSPISESGEPSAVSPSAPEESENNSPAALVDSEDEPEEQADSNTSNILVAYFSHSGNTQKIAELIHDQVGGDIFEIKTVTPYSSKYNTVLDEAQKEKNDKSRPELSAHVDDMAGYDTIILGYPNWWGDMPMAVYSFLDEYDLSGKTVIPFCTHGGSGFSGTVSSIKTTEPDAVVLDGLAIRDSNVGNAQDNVTEWLRGLEILE